MTASFKAIEVKAPPLKALKTYDYFTIEDRVRGERPVTHEVPGLSLSSGRILPQRRCSSRAV